MTEPARMLDAIVTRLKARLQPLTPSESEPRIAVNQSDDTTTTDLSEYMQVVSPGVYVTCLGAPEVGRSQGPMVIDAQWLARCYTRVGLPAGGGKPAYSRGDVAFNLASWVAVVVSQELWVSGNPPAPTAHRAAQRINLTNRGSRALTERGLSLWLVTWSQAIEIQQRDEAAILHSFKSLHTTFENYGIEQTLELEGGTPP